MVFGSTLNLAPASIVNPAPLLLAGPRGCSGETAHHTSDRPGPENPGLPLMARPPLTAVGGCELASRGQRGTRGGICPPRLPSLSERARGSWCWLEAFTADGWWRAGVCGAVGRVAAKARGGNANPPVDNQDRPGKHVGADTTPR